MELHYDKFENMRGRSGRLLTRSLFWEHSHGTGYRPLFTYTREYEFEHKFERKSYRIVPLKRLYFDIADPTEYLFAMEVFLTWDQWCRVSNDQKFKHTLERWREELPLYIRAIGMKNQLELAKDGDRSAGQFLAKKSWEQKAGRPTKAQRAGALKEDAKLGEEYKEDLERIGIQ